MTTAVGLVHLVLGTVYTCYGLMTIVDLWRGWSTRGPSHFGFAWLAMAFTCGPHHLDHAAHVLLTDRPGGGLDLLAVLVGVPAGVTWFLLRVEAMFGGNGDRFLDGTPRWLMVAPVLGAIYAASLSTALGTLTRSGSVDPTILPNLALLLLYGAIAFVLGTTQLRNHRVTGGWSLSGVSLAAVMFTCGYMHTVHSAYAQIGRYDVDIHGLVIDILAIPAAVYFLWVVLALHRGSLRDWNASRAGAHA